MIKGKSVLVVMLSSQLAYGALPPEYQNMKDLNFLMEFIKKHEKVLSTLNSIDFAKYTIHFGNNCKAIFGRRVSVKPPGWAGPADPLEFKNSTCSIDY